MRGVRPRKRQVSDLVNGYFKLRLNHPELKSLSHHFWSLEWDVKPDGAYRKSRDGWTMKVHWDDAMHRLEAIVTSPHGQEWVCH